MRLIGERAHAALVTGLAAVLFAAPMALGWAYPEGTVATAMALILLCASVFADYAGGAFRAFPFKALLAIEFLSGLTLFCAPMLWSSISPAAADWTSLLGFALVMLPLVSGQGSRLSPVSRQGR